jgi:hypothetical protein
MADEKVSPAGAPYVDNSDIKGSKDGQDIVPMEHVELGHDDLSKDHMNYERVDSEVAKYASDVAIDISPEENSRLKTLIDKRVLAVMIITYFLQAIDKGTLSFTSIMGYVLTPSLYPDSLTQ